MNRLSCKLYKSRYSMDFYPALSIDGLPLEVWLPQHDASAELDLVCAHAGLYSDTDSALIWDRSYSVAPGWRTVVPLLVCSDDLDLSCAVIAVEQVADEQHVRWERFGLLRECITHPTPIPEYYDTPPAVFDRDQFIAALDDFRREIGLRMEWDLP
ncbi:hypothetical protein [Pseudomonas nitroreducens]|uniref:hypothetical protein n=2 Tax=Pseudomonas TaxID=286 RepID=UPI001E552D2D|nr:hypothetical protein [Pseudomonas nitroreducens]